MIKSLIVVVSLLTLAACDTMPNRTASDMNSMPSSSRSDATSAATSGAGPTGNGAAASGKAGKSNSNSNSNSGSSDATNGDAGIGAPSSMEAGPSGMAPK